MERNLDELHGLNLDLCPALALEFGRFFCFDIDLGEQVASEGIGVSLF